MLSKAQVKYIQSLSHKKFRDEEKVFVAEGPKIVGELLAQHHLILQHIYATKDWVESHQHLVKKIKPDVLVIIDEKELERISQLSTPNQVLAVLKQFTTADNIDYKNELVLMLDGIQDPGNLGTIIRIADWFGIKHILCSKDCADVYNNKVVQSTMGSIARVQVLYADLAAVLDQQKDTRIYAAVLEGIPVTKISREKAGILLIGNESKGIREDVLRKANKKITIPKIGEAESLNAAVATGIILSHMVKEE